MGDSITLQWKKHRTIQEPFFDTVKKYIVSILYIVYFEKSILTEEMSAIGHGNVTSWFMVGSPVK